jgi:prolyl-tRNA synthetase
VGNARGAGAAKAQVVLARRDIREKSFVPMDVLEQAVLRLLDTIQQALYDRAVAFRDEHTTATDSYDQFKLIMDGLAIAYFAKAY